MTTSKGTNGSEDKIIIKKYANRRLYDTNASAYVTLDHLARLVREERDFIVQDAKTGEDLTRSVLTQIIFEQENRDEGILPISFLRQIIQLYGESVQTVLPSYLELSMNTFLSQQEKWREQLEKTSPYKGNGSVFEAQIRNNISLFEETMKMFMSPAAAHTTPPSPPPEEDTTPKKETENQATDDALSALQQQMADMQKQIEKLAQK
ncbi:polyhydroxyalkanoate synthesis repressor PhaR [Hirschia maritima]|uniref:polyhydroxyalkanoate synthesis repressor PhaR n=1 Tax=Hirschia maritima TaxID=1121961 RepID=UPI000374C66E|nr:polyhydroxyalkanoate synthesis repressor PhaR [Hirschia maritima]